MPMAMGILYYTCPWQWAYYTTHAHGNGHTILHTPTAMGILYYTRPRQWAYYTTHAHGNGHTILHTPMTMGILYYTRPRPGRGFESFWWSRERRRYSFGRWG